MRRFAIYFNSEGYLSVHCVLFVLFFSLQHKHFAFILNADLWFLSFPRLVRLHRR